MEKKYVHTSATLKVPFVEKEYVHTSATLRGPLWKRSMYIQVLH